MPFVSTGSIVVFIIGLITVVTGTYFVGEQYRFEKTGTHGAGTVVGYDEVSRRRGHTSTYPVVSFRGADGRDYKHRIRSAASQKTLPIGSTVALIYDPANPAKVDLDRSQVGLMAAGFLVFLFVPPVVLVLHRKNLLPDFRKRRKKANAPPRKSGAPMTGYTNSITERPVSFDEAIADVEALANLSPDDFVTLVRSDGAMLQLYQGEQNPLIYAEAFNAADERIIFDELPQNGLRPVISAFFDGKPPAQIGLTRNRARDFG